jgi:hypothetical protein
MTIDPFILSFTDYTPSYRIRTYPSISMFYAFFILDYVSKTPVKLATYTIRERCDKMVEKIKRK